MEEYDQGIYYFIDKNSKLNESTIGAIWLHIRESLDYMNHIRYVQLRDQTRECCIV
jgi:hypothetical protein